MLTSEEFRLRFPALSGMTYLASCSQGALSDTLATALLEFQHTMLRHGAPWSIWMGEVERARGLFADLINANVDEIAVLPSVSTAAYQVASTRDWKSRPTIVSTDMEFPSVAHVWDYLGGSMGVAFIAIAAVVVHRLGVLRMGLAITAGQLLGGLVLDLDRGVSATTVGACALVGLAVAVSGMVTARTAEPMVTAA